MAFADDLIVLLDTKAHAQLQLYRIAKFLEKRGMTVNPSKCRCISAVIRDKKLISRSKPFLRINGQDISMVTAISTMKYLGHQYSCTGTSKPAFANLPNWLKYLHHASLKPDQKLDILKTFITPPVIFAAQSPRVTIRTLKDADRLIQLWTKHILHLNIHTSDASIHASIRDGGLSVMELRSNIPNIYLKRLVRLRENDNEPVAQHLTYLEPIEALMQLLSHCVRHTPSRQQWREKIQQGAFTAEDSSSRSWITSKPHGWTGKDFIKALRTFQQLEFPPNPLNAKNVEPVAA